MKWKFLATIALILSLSLLVISRCGHAPAPVRAVGVHQIRLVEEPVSVAGNGGLECVIIDSRGSAVYVSGSGKLVQKTIRHPGNVGEFTSCSVDKSGIAYLFDTANVLYRYSPKEGLSHLGALPETSRILDFTIDEQSGLIWCATTHWSAKAPNLVICLLEAKTGSLIAHLDLVMRAGAAFITPYREQRRVALWLPGDRNVRLLALTGNTISSSTIETDGEVVDVRFHGDDILVGLDSNAVARFDLYTGKRNFTYATRPRPVRRVAVADDIIAIAHGWGNALFGEGSAEFVDASSGDPIGYCESNEGMVTDLVKTSAARFLFAGENGPVHEYSAKDGCRIIDGGSEESDQRIFYLGCSGSTCLVVRSDGIACWQLPS